MKRKIEGFLTAGSEHDGKNVINTENLNVQKLLSFRQKKDSEVDPQSFVGRRHHIEKRIREGSQRHQKNEKNFSCGRLDEVDDAYILAACTDYDDLKRAGVAYKIGDNGNGILEAANRKTSIGALPHDQHYTMDDLITKELKDERVGMNMAGHSGDDGKQELAEKVRKNTEIVKSMFEFKPAHFSNQRHQFSNLPCEEGRGNLANPEISPFPSHVDALGRFQFSQSQFLAYGANFEAAYPLSNVPAVSCTDSSSNGAPSREFSPNAVNAPKKTRSGVLPPRDSVQKAGKNTSAPRAPKALKKMESLAKKYDL
ncbi:LAMI_0H17458g1_1 [Lachancea mirantina]|uniref:LAMI_0H17458g1_1 n=1 Tax=Lachancea mirantina TaxID=1230905 RepID=A0A1G4KJ64_9SACH|nr:LAMI_0H17458g1_1 [Lachancea mirantina]